MESYWKLHINNGYWAKLTLLSSVQCEFSCSLQFRFPNISLTFSKFVRLFQSISVAKALYCFNSPMFRGFHFVETQISRS